MIALTDSKPFDALGLRGRKWEIFESAVALFAAKGYENVSMREIAACNSIQAASLYNYFPSKENLLELMYAFFRANVCASSPHVQGVLDAIPRRTVHETLHALMVYFHPQLQPLMEQIFMVALGQSRRDPRAFQVIWDDLFEQCNHYFTLALERLIEHGRIAPINIEAFTALFDSLTFATLFLSQSARPVGMTGWLTCVDMLFSLVQELPQNEEAAKA